MLERFSLFREHFKAVIQGRGVTRRGKHESMYLAAGCQIFPHKVPRVNVLESLVRRRARCILTASIFHWPLNFCAAVHSNLSFSCVIL